MATSATLTYTKYLDQVRKKDPKVLLGSLVWYAVAETVHIKHKTLCTTLTNVGLGDHLPPEPKDEDVFQRVATSHARKRVETDDPDVYENYMIRTVKRGPDVFIKQIVVEKVNASGKKLGYEPTVQLEFTPADGKFDITNIQRRTNQFGVQRNEQAMNLAELIRKDFKALRGHVNPYSVRELLRRIVGQTGATCVKPTGGIYFIAESHRATIDALVNFAKEFEGVSFHSVPLVNDQAQAEMLREAFEAETKGTVEERLTKINELLAGPEITARRYSDMVREMESIRGRTTEYRDLLDDTLANTDLLMESYTASMKKLFMHVKAD